MRLPAIVAAVPLLTGAVIGVLIAERVSEDFLLAATTGAMLALVAGCAFLADRLTWGVVVCVVAGCLFAGSSLAVSSTRELYTPTLLTWYERAFPATDDARDPEPVMLEGVLKEDGAPGDAGVLLVIVGRRVASAGESRAVNGGVRLSVAGVAPASEIVRWRAGRTVRCPVLLRRPSTFHNPGIPDERRALARRGIVLVGSVKSAALIEVIASASILDEAAASARAWVRRIMQKHVGVHDKTTAAIALSILIGDRTGLRDDDERRLQDAGIYHVIAISGGNIAILTGILLFLGRVLRVPYRCAGLLTIAILLFYGELAGGSPSVSRAVAAAVVFIVALIADHRASPMNVVAVAAVLGVAAAPVTMFDPAFLLSFGATAGIVLGVPRMLAAGNALAALFAATVCAELAIAPIAASFFSRITALGLIANFAAIPLMAIVQSASLVLLAVAAGSSEAANALGFVVHIAAKALLDTSQIVEVVPWLARDVSPPAWWICVLYYLALALVLNKINRFRIAALAALICCLVGSPPLTSRDRVASPARHILRVVVLDVAQGDATLIIPPGGNPLLVDAGGLAGTTFDIGNRVLIPSLRALGIHQLHTFVLTHPDPDHIGGADVLLQRLRTGSIWEGVPVPPHPARQRLIERAATDRLVWRTVRSADVERSGNVHIRVLHPPVPDWERQRVRNDDSVVLEVRYGDVSIVLPGDIGSEIERALIPSLELGGLVILKAAHHGSASSSSEAFIDALKPAAVVFSAGKNNRFGHPAKVVVERFRRRGVEMFNTAHDGAVFVETDGKTVEVRGWLGKKATITSRTPGMGDDTTPRRHDP